MGLSSTMSALVFDEYDARNARTVSCWIQRVLESSGRLTLLTRPTC